MLSIKVKNINGEFHSRLFKDGKVIDEMSCEIKEDISWCCREMLRWFCKMGGNDPWAKAARKRQNLSAPPKGKIKYLGKFLNKKLD